MPVPRARLAFMSAAPRRETARGWPGCYFSTPPFFSGSTFALGMMAQALERIFKLAATGSML